MVHQYLSKISQSLLFARYINLHFSHNQSSRLCTIETLITIHYVQKAQVTPLPIIGQLRRFTFFKSLVQVLHMGRLSSSIFHPISESSCLWTFLETLRNYYLGFSGYIAIIDILKITERYVIFISHTISSSAIPTKIRIFLRPLILIIFKILN